MVDYSFHSVMTDPRDEVIEEIPKLAEAGYPTMKLFMAYKGMLFHSYGKMDQKARAYLFSCAKELGCVIEEDALRNVRIKMPQNQPGRNRVVIGSHVDTVRNGGWLDGIYGVAGGKYR